MSDTDRSAESEMDAVLERMRATVESAIDEARRAFADIGSATQPSAPSPPRAFFASRVMQLAYCLQCGADTETFRGGDPNIAWHAIGNAINISNHYWGSKFELRND